ncbi:hypothetical protein CLAVI_000068 [Candidatus Clavichlamydia salmonicola]|uniref:hypothetical protein n=1 Tax=Candidatus Clavichlamydia salmonicola TaxID=469812 RepID=UPI001891DD48|nr:hypothetical protein [Candidatus Clavichlamydia salmonicola]MBF5050464.1 hypothetical protein [Candidatus Clavichlamydia salmonicola]
MTHNKEFKYLKIETRKNSDQKDATIEKTASVASQKSQSPQINLSNNQQHSFVSMSSHKEDSGINISLKELALQIEVLQKRVQQPLYSDITSE